MMTVFYYAHDQQDHSHTQQIIGNDWDNLVYIMSNAVPSTYARVIMLNPLVKWLRPVVVHTNCTCNKFDAQPHVSDQWDSTLRNFDQTLKPLGCVFKGRGSDGDARRYLLQDATWRKTFKRFCTLQNFASRLQRFWRHHHRRHPRPRGPPAVLTFTGSCPMAIRVPGFTFAVMATYEDNRLVSINGCHSQDTIHKSKRLDMPLQWASKEMLIGNFEANALHLFEARNQMTAEEVRGLRVTDLRRDDRQNFAAVCRRSSNVVRQHLRNLQAGPRPHDTQGTESVYGMIHEYLLIFFSKKMSLANRFEIAGYVCQLLRLWRVSIKFWPNKEERNLDKCFYPNQTFRHVIMTCLSACMYIIMCRELTPNSECLLYLIGSDCCEKLFSMVGGWGILSSWQRSWTFSQFIKKIEDANLLFRFQARGIHVQTHAHEKCEFQNNLHEDMELPDADLRDYPSDDVVEARFRLGMLRANAKCLELGVYHQHIPAAAWLRPWEHDPPNPDPAEMPYDEYLCRKMGGWSDDSQDSDFHPLSDSDNSSTDEDDGSSTDEDDDSSNDEGGDSYTHEGGDSSTAGGDDSSPDEDGDNSLDEDGDSSATSSDDGDGDDHTDVILENAVASLHDDVAATQPDDYKHKIKTPSGKWISKTTAVIMLRELITGDQKKVSADRLRRIEQCASVAASYTKTVLEHGGK